MDTFTSLKGGYHYSSYQIVFDLTVFILFLKRSPADLNFKCFISIKQILILISLKADYRAFSYGYLGVFLIEFI